MRRTSSLVFPLCILKCIGFALTICIVNKHEEGNGGGLVDRLQCSNVTLQTIFNETADSVRSILIFNSNLRYIPERAFARYAKHLQSLNMHHCRINDIHLDGLGSLVNLRKLGLPNNNITRVREAWFKDLVYLEQLDLSFNRIDIIEPVIFEKIPLLKRLDIRENRLACLEPSTLPGGVDKVYFSGNPLTFKCRGKLTLWMRDHGVNYVDGESEKEAWVDKLLWLCAIGDTSVAESEVSMKECIILNLFNQFRTGLEKSNSTIDQCAPERHQLTSCIAAENRHQLTNGNVIKKLLFYIRQTKMN
ncbi:leucine-rich repeat-containing protein 26 [Apis mellifera]|uniref:Leucine-rich repeat-containing protein 26 n=1 Tax=Apis mellifera TaxID=7460 RepID=A0A7M7GJG6_APIME|nr:leucine-rich repeat-containing protein 26 [Apis mellifera]|eukprot:XP_003250993.1 leucine-rich repeat-containing protein 26 [Apis mellifera]